MRPSSLKWLSTCFAVLVAAGSAAGAVAPGITVIGSGFTGAPYQLSGELVLETCDLIDLVRDHAESPEPALVGWQDHSLDGWWRQLAVDGPLAVAVMDPHNTTASGFRVLDISDPQSIGIVAGLDGMDFDSAWLSGAGATLSSGILLVTYDLTQPDAPAFSAANIAGDCPGSRWFSEVGGRLYYIDHDAVLGVLDIADPLHPAPGAAIPVAGARIDALAAGAGVLHALVAGAAGVELVTWDASAPPALVETDRQVVAADAGASGLALAADGDLLLAATSDGAVRAFGLAAPTAPAPGWTLPHLCDRLLLTPSRIMVSNGAELFTYERTGHLAPPPALAVRSSLPRLSWFTGQGGKFIGQLDTSPYPLVVVDATDPAAPRVGAPLDLGGLHGQMVHADGIGTMLEGAATLRLLDLADPENLVPLGAITYPDSASLGSYLPGGNLLYVSVFLGEQIIRELRDISDPTAPGPPFVPFDNDIRHADGDLVFCGSRGNLRVWSVPDLATPVQLSTLSFPGSDVGQMRLYGNHLYLATHEGFEATLRVYDLADPAAPVVLPTIAPGMTVRQLDLHGNRLYVSGWRGVKVYDLVDPDQPALIGEIATPFHSGLGFGSHGNISFVGPWLLAVRNDGLSPSGVDRGPAASAFRLEPATPNPFNPATRIAFTLDGPRSLAVTVYDVRGRRVAGQSSREFAEGRHEWAWDGRDDAGAAAGAGVYFLRVHGDGVEAVRTATLVK